jgi:hypothetical protein
MLNELRRREGSTDLLRLCAGGNFNTANAFSVKLRVALSWSYRVDDIFN